jgi:hypothetical protein
VTVWGLLVDGGEDDWRRVVLSADGGEPGPFAGVESVAVGTLDDVGVDEVASDAAGTDGGGAGEADGASRAGGKVISLPGSAAALRR